MAAWEGSLRFSAPLLETSGHYATSSVLESNPHRRRLEKVFRSTLAVRHPSCNWLIWTATKWTLWWDLLSVWLKVYVSFNCAIRHPRPGYCGITFAQKKPVISLDMCVLRCFCCCWWGFIRSRSEPRGWESFFCSRQNLSAQLSSAQILQPKQSVLQHAHMLPKKNSTPRTET